MAIRKTHTCISVAEGCKRSTMATFKNKQYSKKVTCGACSENVAAGRPQHAVDEGG